MSPDEINSFQWKLTYILYLNSYRGNIIMMFDLYNCFI